MVIATKLSSIVTCLDGLLIVKSHDPLVTRGFNHKVIKRFDQVVLQDHLTNENFYICTTRVSMATKLGRMITYLDGLLATEAHDPFITWSCEITWQNKPLFLQYHSAYGHQTYSTHCSSGFAQSRDKLKPLCLHYYSVYDQQDYDLPTGAPIVLVTRYITWSSVITWQTKNIRLLLQYLWPPNLTRWWQWHTMKSCNS